MSSLVIAACRARLYCKVSLLIISDAFLLALSMALLIAVLTPEFGLSAGGATRWLRIGHLTFQPSELARMALIIFLAYSLEIKAHTLKQFSV